ncbi:unnamed protein product [Dovyalis caffra]|uniref:Leucine-rich repeat-containing N-terminal plant-type domain-containing protein n=1 Tax=Dovyalis caffra TaxID=77055 RepID=A0AAV1QV94_9ROSI|nr:unnamed protein product [Dovyalis caffra]
MRKLSPYGVVSLLAMLCICCNFGWCIGCLDDERRALQEIIDSMGFQSESSPSESYSDDCCQWEGVDCSLTSSHVVRIFFDHARDVDYAREEEELWFPDMDLFSQIKELQELQLTGNRIGGLVNPEG